MNVLVVLGAFGGAGLVLVHRAIVPWTASLAAAVARAHGDGVPVSDSRVGLGRRQRVGARLVGRSAQRLAADLVVVDWSPTRLGVEKLSMGVGLAAVPVLLGVLMAVAGTEPPVAVLALTALAGGVGGFVLPDSMVRRRARRRRTAFVHALSSYLDLVTVLLAGGAGIESALTAAADAR